MFFFKTRFEKAQQKTRSWQDTSVSSMWKIFPRQSTELVGSSPNCTVWNCTLYHYPCNWFVAFNSFIVGTKLQRTRTSPSYCHWRVSITGNHNWRGSLPYSWWLPLWEFRTFFHNRPNTDWYRPKTTYQIRNIDPKEEDQVKNKTYIKSNLKN